MSTTIYCVVVNMPGYLPEDEPVFFASLDAAKEYAAERAQELANEENDRYVVDIIDVAYDPTNPDHAEIA